MVDSKSVEVILDACCTGREEARRRKGCGRSGENAPKAAKKKTTKARMDKAEEDAINAAKAAAFIGKDEEA